MKRLTLALLSAATLSPAVASAADRMFSYDPVSADARRLTGRGLTFIFDQGVMRTRARRILATAVSAQAELKPVGDGVLGKGGRSALIKAGAPPFEGELYEVDPDKAQGRVYARAWCPGGSTRLWVAIGRFSYSKPLTITALGDDPANPGQAKVCARMDFDFKGEWRLPGRGAPDPMEDPLLGSGIDAAGS
jgi:hypothetical protein